MSKRKVENTVAKNARAAEALLKPLANAERLMLLCALAERPHTVSELIKLSKLSQSSVSQHLALLSEAGIIYGTKQGRHKLYSLNSMEAKALLSVLHIIYCK